MSSLRSRFDGEFGLPGSEIYSEGRRIWYPPARKREPLAVIRPAGTDDVVNVVKWARREGLRLSPRSGGHSFDGFPVQPGTILLDLSQLSYSHLSADGILQVQPGAQALSLANALSPQGRALPTGDCGSVALGGLLAGGGFGYASRQMGLTIDSVIEAIVVTGEGNVVRASDRENQDLFWACRGGGGTAGIVTEFMVRSFPVDQVTAFSMTWAWDSVRDAILAFDEAITTAPRSFDLKLKIRTTGKERFLDFASSGPPGCVPGTPIVEMSGQYLGDRAEAEAFLDPLLDHAGVSNAEVNEESYFNAMLDLMPLPTLDDTAPETLRPVRVASDYMDMAMDRLFAEEIVGYIDCLQNSPDFWGGCLLIEPCDGAVGDVPVGSTAYPHRNNRLLLQWELIHPINQSDVEIALLDQFLTNTRQKLAPRLKNDRYLNYAGARLYCT
ncbi:MAG: FAD-binding oxidoreductase [Pseudomonadota bacterium]